MARSICYIATSDDDGIRIDKLLANKEIYPSRNNAQNAIENGLVLVSGMPVNKKYEVHTGDPIIYTLVEPESKSEVQGEPIDLDIRYEDDDLIVLSKQKGLVCHPTDDIRSNTLVNALIHKYGEANLCNVQGENDRLGIVHRLDGDTSGLMLCAKTDEAGQLLMDDIRNRNVDRRYLSLVHGIISPDSGMIDAPISRSNSNRMKMCVGDKGKSRDAITTFKVIERFDPSAKDNGYTLIECKLYTGRTHQIRAHSEYIKHPVVGDVVYTAHAPKSPQANLGLDRQFLHSYKLGFAHPITDKYMVFEDHLPDDLQSALEKIAGRSRGKTDFGKENFN